MQIKHKTTGFEKKSVAQSNSNSWYQYLFILVSQALIPKGTRKEGLGDIYPHNGSHTGKTPGKTPELREAHSF